MDNELQTLTIHGLSTRDKAFMAEALMKQMPQQVLKVEHFFSLGVYARCLYIPKNTTLVGKIHKYENLNILMQGKMQVSIEDKIEIVKAPFIVVSPAGTKRIAYTLEDCIWATIHGTDEKNIDKIETHFIAQTEAEYLTFIKQEQTQLTLGI